MCCHANQSSLDFDEGFKMTVPEHFVKVGQDLCHMHGFSYPMLYVIASNKPEELQQMEWD